MANYVIGDIQGCYDKFLQLLAELSFNRGTDNLYLVGDVVNRGNNSCDMLKWCYKNSDIVTSVLGNHDIYFLARYCGIRSKDDDDTLDDLLRDENIDKLVSYVRSWQLLTFCEDSYIVHAGLYPHIGIDTFKSLESAISHNLLSANYREFINMIYGNKPHTWNDSLTHNEKMKFIINSSTRMRYIDKNDFSLDYKLKCHPSKLPLGNDLVPWFKFNHIATDKHIIFGHWASLGYMRYNNCIALDSGCIWGNQLTAIDIATKDIIQV